MTNMADNDALLPVEQVDRDAAERVADDTGATVAECVRIQRGERDESYFVQAFARHRLAALRTPQQDETLQKRVDAWMDACFGEAIKSDRLERADRFIEEALELAQTEPSFTADRAHALVDYVFGRDVGDPGQEVGGVMITLAALCNTIGIDIGVAAETELARIWTKVDQIRAKQAGKPTGSALPVAALEPAQDEVERVAVAVAKLLYGPNFDPFQQPETLDFCQKIATAAIAAMRPTDERAAIVAAPPEPAATAN